MCRTTAPLQASSPVTAPQSQIQFERNRIEEQRSSTQDPRGGAPPTGQPLARGERFAPKVNNVEVQPYGTENDGQYDNGEEHPECDEGWPTDNSAPTENVR